MTTPSADRPATRRTLLLGLLLAPTIVAAATPCRPTRVLFVCPAGTVKSAIAREQLKQSAAQRGLKVEVHSRGVSPADHMTPELAAKLQHDGIDPRAEPLRPLAQSDIAHADVVVGFEEAIAAPGMARARAWDIPSWKTDYAGARAAMLPKIDALLDEIARKPCPA